MTSVVKRALGVSLNLLCIPRLYFFENSTCSHKFQAYLICALFVWPIPCLGILNLFMKDELDMERVSYDATSLAETACCILKYIFFIKPAEKVKKCINYFEHSPFIIHLNPKQERIQEYYIKICRRNTFVYLGVVAGGITSWIVKPFFWEKLQLPVDIWLPFEISSKTHVFYLVYLFLVMCILYIGIMSAIDPLIGALACLTTAQLRILQDKLKCLDIYAVEDLEKEGNVNLHKDDIIYNHIQKCVLFHNEIINVMKEFEECFSLIVFSQILTAVCAVCFACLWITKLNATDIPNIFQMSSYIFIMIAQVYFYCNYGSTVGYKSKESNNLTNAIYMSNWYNYNMKSKKALGVLMARSQKPIIILSGGIIELSLDTFVVTLKRTYSLIAVLKNYA